NISAPLLTGLTRLFETLAILAIGVAVHFFYVVPADGGDTLYTLPLAAGTVLAALFLQAVGAYRVASLRTYVSQLGRIFAAWTAVFACLALALFFTKTGDVFSRVWFGSWYLGGIAFFALFRPLLSSLVRRWTRDGRLERRAVIVGGGKNAEELILSLIGQPG